MIALTPVFFFGLTSTFPRNSSNPVQVSTSFYTVVTVSTSTTSSLTQATVTALQTALSTVVTVGPAIGPTSGVPGFPLESILAGIVIGLVALGILRYRRSR